MLVCSTPLWERETFGAGSGSILLTIGSGSGRSKNMLILRIRIPNTVFLLSKLSFSRNAVNTNMNFTMQILRHIQRLEKDRDVLLREDIISLYVHKRRRPFFLFLFYRVISCLCWSVSSFTISSNGLYVLYVYPTGPFHLSILVSCPLWPAPHQWDLAEWLERLTANAKVATVLSSIPASSDTVESEGRQMKQCW